MPETENQKQLRIKLSSVKRIEKETASYVKEAEKQKEKIAKLEAENGEQAYINKQKQVLQETESMILIAKVVTIQHWKILNYLLKICRG